MMLGASDAQGRVEGSIDGDAKFELLAETNGEFALGSFGETLTATPGRTIERTFVVRAGHLVIEAPPSLQRPDDGLVQIDISGSDIGSKTFRAYGPRAQLRPAVSHPWQSRTIDFGPFPPGDYSLTISFVRGVEDDTQPEGVRFENLVEPHSTDVRIVDGQEARVTVP